MTINLRNAPAYALVSPSPKLNVRQVVTYALISEKQPLPKNIRPENAIIGTIRKKANDDLSNVDISLSLPSAVDRDPENTMVVATGYGVTVDGDKTFYYRRRPLEDIVQGVTLPILDLGEITSVSEVISWLSARTGVIVTNSDIVDQPLQVNEEGYLTLIASVGSYWFTPGSTIVLQTTN